MNDDKTKISGQNDDDFIPLSDDGGAGDISGSEADLDSDDETLDAAHSMGLYQDATDDGEGYQQEVGIGKEVNDAEEEHIEED